MSDGIFLELYAFDQDDNEDGKPITLRNSTLYESVDGVLVPEEDKSSLPEMDYAYEDDIEEFPDVEFQSLVSQKCTKKNLGTLYHVPQFKMKGIKCYKRYKKYALFVRYCYPADVEDAIEAAIKDCAGVGFIAALPFIPNIPAMGSAFYAAFKACIIKKGLQELDGFSFRVYKASYYTKWKRC